ncbi:MAG TPA: SemiSWEET transporter [archaeon]|nr:SemiSWEET transporter [archaeon]
MVDPLLIGSAAGFFTTIAALPQLLKAYKTKSTKDISEPMLIITCLGVFLWLSYGLLRSDLPLIIANIFTFTFWFLIFALKFKYDGLSFL